MATTGTTILEITATSDACPYCGVVDPEPETHVARVHESRRWSAWVCRSLAEGRRYPWLVAVKELGPMKRTIGIPLYDQPPLHSKAHGGWATAAKKRGEQYVACDDCGVVSRAYRPEDEGEGYADFAKAFVAFAFLLGTFIVFAYVMAAAS